MIILIRNLQLSFRAQRNSQWEHHSVALSLSIKALLRVVDVPKCCVNPKTKRRAGQKTKKQCIGLRRIELRFHPHQECALPLHHKPHTRSWCASSQLLVDSILTTSGRAQLQRQQSFWCVILQRIDTKKLLHCDTNVWPGWCIKKEFLCSLESTSTGVFQELQQQIKIAL